ncbi:MAG: TolC family protein [Holophagaceae bacterium]|uniref:TolC family protein n=1 Tax=Candidatus Geothrix odensensis TaxID=2954440 RepID=A0A936F0M2_9BACT|nr:TolC family protein [Candidatus Geothrix odensensis]
MALPVLLCPLGAQEATPVLTEAQAITRALARPEWQALTQLPAKQTEGAALEARSWLSPGVEWTREQFNGIQPGKREDTFLLSQSFDISGRRLARRDAALKREEGGKAESEQRVAGVVAQVREALYEVLVARERLARLEGSISRVGRFQERVDRLHQAGEMSGLDRGRVRREVELLRGREVVERSRLLQAEARLQSLLGGTPGTVQGDLLPEPPATLDAYVAEQPGAPATRMALAQEAAALSDAKAAGRWAPELQLGLGVKRWQEAGLTGNGNVFSLGMTFPTPGRVNAARVRGEAEARAASAQARLQREQDGAELRALWQASVDLRASAGRMAKEALADSGRVDAALDAAFAAGELDLLGRLDGARSLLEAELAALDQAHAARRTRIALDRMLGKVNP